MIHPGIVYCNGQWCKPEDAKVSVFDRSYLYGDSLYEVVRTYHGKIYGMENHLDRLWISAKLCQMTIDQSRSAIEKIIEESVSQYYSLPDTKGTEAYVRLILSRGTGKIGFSEKSRLTGTEVVTVTQIIQEPTLEKRLQGTHLKTSSRFRNHPNALDPAMKSGNYLNCLLAFIEAEREGYDDAILCDGDGMVTEGTTFNVFYIKGNVLVTPPFEIGILQGITRKTVMECAHEIGLETREVYFPVHRFYEADEAFLTGTVKEVFPIATLDRKKIGSGKGGPMTLKLFEKFREHVERAL